MPTYIRVKDLPNAATSPASDDFILLSGTANGARRISRADFLSAVAGFYTADPSTYKLATLDAGNKVLVSQLPSAAFSYKGTWAASSNTPSLANGTGTAGDTYYASDSGSVNFGAGSISFLAGDAVVYDGTIWQKVPDVVNLLDGKGTLDEAKTTLEIPDVGLQPNQVPLSGQLGTMAFQDADGVSVASLEVTDKIVDSVEVNASVKPVIRLSGSGNDADGTNYGAIEFYNRDASIDGPNVGAQIHVESSSVNGAGGELVFSTERSSSEGEGSAPLERVRIDDSGRVGIGTSSPSGKLTIETGSGNGIQLYRSAANANFDAITFRNTTNTGTNAKVGFNVNELRLEGTTKIGFNTNGSERWVINSAGDLVSSGGAIDFGSTNTNTGVTVTGSVMSEYEQGTFTPKLADAATGGNVATYSTNAGDYIRVGNQVFFALRLIDINTTGLTSGNTIYITDMPYQCKSGSSFVPCNVMADSLTFTGQVTATLQGGVSYLILKEFSSGGADASLTVSAISSGVTDLFITGSYLVA